MSTHKIALIVVLSVLAAGCQHNQKRDIEEQRRAVQKDREIDTAGKECSDALAAVNNKLNVDALKCVQPKIRRIFLKYDGRRDIDIYDLFGARVMLIASKLDAGKITPEEGDIEFNEAQLQSTNEIQRRALIRYNMDMQALRIENRYTVGDSLREIGEGIKRRSDTSTTNCFRTPGGGMSCTTR